MNNFLIKIFLFFILPPDIKLILFLAKTILFLINLYRFYKHRKGFKYKIHQLYKSKKKKFKFNILKIKNFIRNI